MAPNTPIATGAVAIRTLFSELFGLPGFSIKWTPVRASVSRSGDLGYTSGVYHFSFRDAKRKTIHDVGKYVTVWKKQSDGSWKVMLDIFNSDLPPS